MSAAAKRFLAETGIPCFPLDCLMMGFAHGLPEQGVDPEDDEWLIADILWPVVKPMATTFVEEELDYLIEGAPLRSRHAWELCNERPGAVRPCFLGFAEVDTQATLNQVRTFGGGSDDWLRHLSDEHVIQEIERLKGQSRKLRVECGRYGIRYVETSTDLDETVDTVIGYLRG